MGSGQTKSVNTQKRNDKPSSKRKKLDTTISDNDFNFFQQGLSKFPFGLTEKEFSQLLHGVEVATVKKGETLVQEGQEGKGIFVVVEGSCIVYDSEKVAIRFIEEGDFFGEISTIFSEPCTATVRCSDHMPCRFFLIHSDLFTKVLNKENVNKLSKFDLFMSRKYLDLNGSFRHNELAYEMLFDCLRNVPVFYDWRENGLRQLVSGYPDSPFNIFPPKTVLYGEGEENNNAYLLLLGKIEIHLQNQDGNSNNLILISGPHGLWFGDEALFCGSKRRSKVVTLTPCHIFTISATYIQSFLDDYPFDAAKLAFITSKWEFAMEQRDKSLYEQSGGKFDTELVRLFLRKTRLFKRVSPGFLYLTALGTVIRHYTKKQVVLSGEDCLENIILVLQGRMKLFSGTSILRTYESNDVFFIKASSHEADLLQLNCDEESVIGFIHRSILDETVNIYPESVLNWNEE